VSGLCAVVHHGDTPIHPTTLTRMTQAAPHRGPATTHTTAHAHLAQHTHHHERPHTHRHTTIIASARIDNQDELLPHLRTHLTNPHPTDTELILAAHHHWGPDAPHHLIGDYAYLIHDHHTHTTHAARDPMGMRPLYYHHTPQRTLFASEAKQILAAPGVEDRLCEPIVAAYLAGPYGRDDGSFFEGILRLPPAHALTANAGGLKVWRYWSPDPEREERFAREEDYAERLRDLLLQAVRDRIGGPGHVGLMLSGGVDSGSIAAAAGWLHERGEVADPLRTYSWAYETIPVGDERGVSRRITQRYGLPAVDVPGDDTWVLMDDPAYRPDRDDPFLGMFQVMQERSHAAAARDGVTSLLSGDRGDPLLGDGVFDHVGPFRAGRWGLWVRELSAQARSSGGSRRGAIRRHFLRPLLEDVGVLPPAHADPSRLVPDFLRPDWVARTGLLDLVAADRARPPVRGHARAARHARAFLFRGLLDPVPQERLRARYGMTFADPWADRRVMEFVLAVPPWRLQRPSEPKRLAKLALGGMLPAATVQVLGKAEPAHLYERGLRDRARATAIDLLTGSRLEAFGFVDGDALRAGFDRYLAGHDMSYEFWWALTLELWLRSRNL
jgi:asparagine synthase (glutamine-hydrolysing)